MKTLDHPMREHSSTLAFIFILAIIVVITILSTTSCSNKFCPVYDKYYYAR